MQTNTQNKHDQFTGFEYLLIDIAAQWGLDKMTFPERLEWAYANFQDFEDIAQQRGHWKEKPLFIKGVMALRGAQAGEPTGHIIGFDAVCSGMQILSVLSGCEKGARSTGMVDPDVRADAYTNCTDAMRRRLPGLADINRKDIKQACMTTLYGSVAEPEKLFGEGTEELAAFYQSLMEIAPGACALIDIFRSAWQRYALKHTWALPDNHHADVPVMDKIETRVEVDELDHSKFNYIYSVNRGAKKGISLIANITHSCDAYLLRSIIRRCNYSPAVASMADTCIQQELLQRELTNDEGHRVAPEYSPETDTPLDALLRRYAESQVPCISILDHLNSFNVHQFSTKHLRALQNVLEDMAGHDPFEVVCVHDEFKCSPNNMNHLRMHYRQIMAEMAESTLLEDLITQVTGTAPKFEKLSSTLADKIRLSNYAIC